jgi:hypothetical protein
MQHTCMHDNLLYMSYTKFKNVYLFRGLLNSPHRKLLLFITDLLALDRRQCKLEMALLIGHYISRQQLGEDSLCTPHECSDLVRHFSCAL